MEMSYALVGSVNSLIPLKIENDIKNPYPSEPLIKGSTIMRPIGDSSKALTKKRNVQHEMLSLEKPDVDTLISRKVEKIRRWERLYKESGKGTLWKEMLKEEAKKTQSLIKIFESPTNLDDELLWEICSSALVVDSLNEHEKKELRRKCEDVGGKCFQQTENDWEEISSSARHRIRKEYTKALSLWELAR